MNPLAALNEAIALNEFYRNRVLALAHEAFALREQLEQLQEQLADNEHGENNGD